MNNKEIFNDLREVLTYLYKKLNFKFEVRSIEKSGKDYQIKIDTEDGGGYVVVRESGKNGNFRITVMDI